MSNDALNEFIKKLNDAWGPLDTTFTKRSLDLVQQLADASAGSTWFQELIRNHEPATEIYRSSDHGFVLMGHVEQTDEFSPPHDHGSGWVIYSVVQGRNEMGVFNRAVSPNGVLQLVQKDAYVMSSGQSRVFLPGDIHYTKALDENTVMLRLTSCDLFDEINAGRLIRYSDATIW